jgi:S1-C subfamily serine protease
VVAVAGIPLFGLVTGLVAVILGSVALGSIYNTRQRGTGLALAGVLLGVADVVGWLVFLSVTLWRPGPNLTIDDFEPDLAALENLAPHISRAMKANVLISTEDGWGTASDAGMGSGVVVHLSEGKALIVTCRHVIDPGFAAGRPSQASDTGKSSRCTIKLVGQLTQPGHVVWIAPHGIDLAVVSTAVHGNQVQAAHWRSDPQLSVGEEVFAIGNPHGLGWTHTPGVISQLRLQERGGRKIRIIQTNAAINPGNSGGGLYDKDGMLIGINTWTNDKRVSEGLSFAIAFDSLLAFEAPQLKPLRKSEEPDEP